VFRVILRQFPSYAEQHRGGARTQPWLAPLQIWKVLNAEPSNWILAFMLSRNAGRSESSVSWQHNSFEYAAQAGRFAVSKALFRSMKASYCWRDCWMLFSWSYLSGNTMSVIFLEGCCNLSGGVTLIVWYTTNGMYARKNNIYMLREQTIIEWSRRVSSIVACCHSAKLCVHAAWTSPIATEAKATLTLRENSFSNLPNS